jgi:hypothetical protein
MAADHRHEDFIRGRAFQESGSGELGMVGHGIGAADLEFDPDAG